MDDAEVEVDSTVVMHGDESMLGVAGLLLLDGWYRL